jgi:plastocyanin
MKKSYFIFAICLLTRVTGFTSTHIITASGLMFSPDSISANIGDTVFFNITSFHSAIEVSQSTWNLNGGTSNGGFQLPLGGGMVILNQVKTYYYVCGVHFSSGMKGRIFVTNSTGIVTVNKEDPIFEILPNPATKRIKIKSNLMSSRQNNLNIFDITGSCVFHREHISFDEYLEIDIPCGIYFLAFNSDSFQIEKKLVIAR